MENDIVSRIEQASPNLSKGQKKIASAILKYYDKTAFMTASMLGEMVGVSESTVVRFATMLGFEGYSEFQDAVQEYVRTKLTPNQRIDVTKKRVGDGDIIEKVMESDIKKIRITLKNVNREHFFKSVDAILDAKTIYIMGARSTEPLAMVLKYNLSLIFDNVKYIYPTSTEEVLEQMLPISEQDVLFAISFPRYSSKSVSAVNYASHKGATVITLTDSNFSPLARYSSYLLTAQSDMASFMDSFVAPLSIINAIIVEITNRREIEIKNRFNLLEEVWKENKVYTVSS